MYKASVLDLLYQCCAPPASRSLSNLTQAADDSCTEVNDMYTLALTHAPYAPLSATLALQLCALRYQRTCHCGATMYLLCLISLSRTSSARMCIRGHLRLVYLVHCTSRLVPLGAHEPSAASVYNQTSFRLLLFNTVTHRHALTNNTNKL